MKKVLIGFIMSVLCLTVNAQLTGANELSSTIIYTTPQDVDHQMYGGTNFRNYGTTMVKGSSKIFGVKFDYDEPSSKKGYLRFALYNMQKEIVELYEPMKINILAGGINGYAIPCIVNAPAGDYYIVPLFRFEGESYWTALYFSIFHPDNDWRDFTLTQWKYTVIDEKLPMVNQVICSKTASLLEQGEYFDLTLKLSNRTDTKLDGKFKIMHERNIKKFVPGYNYSPGQSDEEFFYSVSRFANINGVESTGDGCFDLTLASGETKNIVVENCVSFVEHGIYDQFLGQFNLYYLPFGKSDVAENWIMLQENCSSLFENGLLKYTEINDEYWTHVTQLDADTRNYCGAYIGPKPENLPSIDMATVGLTYTKADGQVTLTNLPLPYRVTIGQTTGNAVLLSKLGSTQGASLNFKNLQAGTYHLKIWDYTDNVIKTLNIVK